MIIFNYPLAWLARNGAGVAQPFAGFARRSASVAAPSNRVAAHLRRARDLLAGPGVWLQHAYAQDEWGEPVDSLGAEAGRFCCSGALFATQQPGDRTVDARLLLSRAIANDIEIWNDAPGRRRSEVLAAFDRAIGLATAGAEPAGSDGKRPF